MSRGKMNPRTNPPLSRRAKPAESKRRVLRKGQRSKGGGGMLSRALQAFDANHPAHLPLPMRISPYVVQRCIQNISIQASTTEVTYLLIGPQRLENSQSASVSGPYLTPLVALSGLGSTLLSAATPYTSSDLASLGSSASSYGAAAEATCSAMSASLLCTSNMNLGGGLVWMGRSPGALDRIDNSTLPLTFDRLVGGFIGRPGVLPMSYYELFKSKIVHSIPMDMVDYMSFDPVYASGTAPSVATLEFDHGLAPIVVVFSAVPPGLSVTYNIRVAMEFRVRYPMSLAQSSLHESWTPTPQGVFDALVGEVESLTGGVTEGIGSSVGAALFTGAPSNQGRSRGGFGRMGPRA